MSAATSDVETITKYLDTSLDLNIIELETRIINRLDILDIFYREQNCYKMWCGKAIDLKVIIGQWFDNPDPRRFIRYFVSDLSELSIMITISLQIAQEYFNKLVFEHHKRLIGSLFLPDDDKAIVLQLAVHAAVETNRILEEKLSSLMADNNIEQYQSCTAKMVDFYRTLKWYLEEEIQFFLRKKDPSNYCPHTTNDLKEPATMDYASRTVAHNIVTKNFIV